MEAKGMFSVGKNMLLPNDDRGREIMAALKAGDRVLMHVHKARNPEHHRLAFAVFAKIADAKGVSAETVLTWLKVATGRVDFVQMPSGKMVAAPQSVSFESMSQGEFQKFWDECLPIISEQILPDLPQQEMDEILTILAGDAA